MKPLKLVFLTLAMLASLTVHAQTIAVVDSQMALLESDAAKKYATETEKLFAPRIKVLQAAEDELRAMDQALQKDGLTLTAAQREQRQIEMRRKVEDLQAQERQLRADKVQSDQAELAKVQPKLRGAIEAVSTELNYDVVLERGAASYVKPEFDITRRVIERMNKMK